MLGALPPRTYRMYLHGLLATPVTRHTELRVVQSITHRTAVRRLRVPFLLLHGRFRGRRKRAGGGEGSGGKCSSLAPEEHHSAQVRPRDVWKVWLGGDLDAPGEDSSHEEVARGSSSGADGERESEAVLDARVVRHAADEAVASHGVGSGVDAAKGVALSDAGSEKFHPAEGHPARAVEDVLGDGALEGALEHGHELLEGEFFLPVVVAHHVHLLEGVVRADARHCAVVTPEFLGNLGVLEELAARGGPRETRRDGDSARRQSPRRP